MKTKIFLKYVLSTLFAASVLTPQTAHAGWIMDWINCQETVGWIGNCGCCAGNGGEVMAPRNPGEQKAAAELRKVMESFQSGLKSLSPDAKKLLNNRKDLKGRSDVSQ